MCNIPDTTLQQHYINNDKILTTVHPQPPPQEDNKSSTDTSTISFAVKEYRRE